MGKKEKGNGEGTIYKSSKTGLYIGQYVYDGKRHSVYQKKKEKIGDFKKRFNDILSSINTGTYIKKNNDTFISILEKHIEQKYKDDLISPSSYIRDCATKKQIEKTCSNFTNKPIQKITIDDIQYSKDNIRNYADNTINKIWRMINKTFNIAISRRLIVFNPLSDENLVKPISKITTDKVKALSSAEETKLLDYLDSIEGYSQYKYIVLLQLNTGMRIGEILSLSYDSINLKENTITVSRTLTKDEDNKFILGQHTKTYDRKHRIDKGKRTFPMTQTTRNIVTEILKQKITNINNLLFWDYSKDSFILPKRINDFLKNNIDKNIKTHRLRHTFITKCQEKDIPLPVIQAMVGHIEGSPITSDVYTSISLDFMKKSIEKINA